MHARAETVSARWFGQDVRDAIRQLTLEEQDNLSDDDYIAVLEEVGKEKVVRITIVEAMVRTRTSADGRWLCPEPATRLALDEPSGELVLRLLEPIGVGEMQCRRDTDAPDLSHGV